MESYQTAAKLNGAWRYLTICTGNMEGAERELKVLHPDASAYCVWNPDHRPATRNDCEDFDNIETRAKYHSRTANYIGTSARKGIKYRIWRLGDGSWYARQERATADPDGPSAFAGSSLAQISNRLKEY